MTDANPSIFVTTPSSGGPMPSEGRYSMMPNAQAFPGIHNVSPHSSPTGVEFDYAHPRHQMHAMANQAPGTSHHHLRHAQSMQHMSSYETAYGSAPGSSDSANVDFDGASNGDRKRQRTDAEPRNRLSRARSDSVPLNYATPGGWNRPRTGSGMVFGSTNGPVTSGISMPGVPNISGQHTHPQGQSVSSPLANMPPKSG